MNKELKKQSTIIIAKMSLFFLVYLLLVAYGGFFIYSAYYFFANFSLPHLQYSFEGENYIALIFFIVITIAVCGFLFLYGLYPLKFIFGKSKKSDVSRIETTEEENPRLFKIIQEVADATGNKMPKHVFLSEEVNACVFYDNTLMSLLFPTRKNLMIGLGLCVNTNTEEMKSIIAHEFGHFAQNTMKVGSAIYYLNSIMYNMAFQDDLWDSLLDGYYKVICDFCRIASWYGVIIWLLFTLLYYILGLTKNVLRWMYKFVNKSYFSLSRQMEFDADVVACNLVGKEYFISALIKVEFCSSCESNAITAWKRLIGEGKYASFFDVFKLFENFKAQEQEVVLSYDTILHNVEDLEECHSNISFVNVYSDHPSTQERICAVEKFQSSGQQKVLPAWSLFDQMLIEKLEKRCRVSAETLSNRRMSYDLQIIEEDKLKDWIKKDFEGVCFPKKYRPFFEEIFPFDIADIKLNEYKSYPFSEKNRDLFKNLKTERKDRNIMLDLNNQDDIKYAIYRGVRYKIEDLPFKEQLENLKEITKECQHISVEVFAYLYNNSSNMIKNMYFYLFEGYKAVNYIDDLDVDIEKMRDHYMSPDDDEYGSDDFCDLKIDFGSFESRKFKPFLQECNKILFPVCLKIGENKEYIARLLKIANSPTPDYTIYHITDVVEVINGCIQAKQQVRSLISDMITKIKIDLCNEAIAIEKRSE